MFQELQTAYEVLSPDPFLRDYLDDYVLIVQVYQIVYNYFDPEAAKRRAQRDLLKKTDALIRQNVSVAGYLGTLPLYPINRDLANVIEADNVSDRVKVTNLYRSLVVHIEQHQDEQPYLISIGDEVENVIRLLREQQFIKRGLQKLGKQSLSPQRREGRACPACLRLRQQAAPVAAACGLHRPAQVSKVEGVRGRF